MEPGDRNEDHQAVPDIGTRNASSFRPVLSLRALVLFGLAFVGPTAPYTFFGVGAAQSAATSPWCT